MGDLEAWQERYEHKVVFLLKNKLFLGSRVGPRGVAWAFLDLGAGCSSGWHSNESSKGSVYLVMPLKQAFLVRGRGKGRGTNSSYATPFGMMKAIQ